MNFEEGKNEGKMLFEHRHCSDTPSNALFLISGPIYDMSFEEIPHFYTLCYRNPGTSSTYFPHHTTAHKLETVRITHKSSILYET